MKVKEYWRRIFSKREEDVKEIAKQKTEKVTQEMSEKQGEEEQQTSIRITAQIAYEQYREGLKKVPKEQQEEFIREFTKLLIEKPEIPQEVVPQYIIEASQKNEMNQMVSAIKELPDSQVEEIVLAEDSHFSWKEREKIVKEGINDIKLKHKTLEELRREEQARRDKELKKELRYQYATCGETVGQRLLYDLQQLDYQTQNPEIKNMIKQILARKAAIDCKLLGATRIVGMTRILPAESMLSGNFLDLIEEEFESIKDKEEYKGDKKDFARVKENLVEQISQEIAKEQKRLEEKKEQKEHDE